MDKHIFLIDCDWERELVLFFRKALTFPDCNVFRYSYPPSLWCAASLALKHYDTTERSQWLSPLKTQYSYLSIVSLHTHTRTHTHTHSFFYPPPDGDSTFSNCQHCFHTVLKLNFIAPLHCSFVHIQHSVFPYTHTHTHTHSHFLSLWMMSCSPVLNLLPYDMVSCSAENIKTDCETQTDREWQWKRHTSEFNLFLSVLGSFCIIQPYLQTGFENMLMEKVKSGLSGCVHAGDNKTQITTLHTWEHALSGVTFLIHFVTQYIWRWSDLCLQCALPCATASVNVVKLFMKWSRSPKINLNSFNSHWSLNSESNYCNMKKYNIYFIF